MLNKDTGNIIKIFDDFSGDFVFYKKSKTFSKMIDIVKIASINIAPCGNNL
ncbi:hypothetical protein [Campylobacter hominis]